MTPPHIAIVGAGPAGSAAAARLAQAGLDVTLLERRHTPRDKTCGDGLTPRALWMLERLGLADVVGSQAAPIDAVFLRSPGGRELAAPMPRHVFGGRGGVLPRRELDQLLLERATALGASVRDGVRVDSVREGDDGVELGLAGDADSSLRADVVIGADGFHSTVRRATGAPRLGPADHAMAVRQYFRGVTLSHPTAFGIFWERDLLPAYGWIFPTPGGGANVGVGIRADQLRALGTTLSRLYEAFLARPRVQEELRGAVPEGRPLGHPLPFRGLDDGLVRGRALLVGDAAGFVNPLTGEGIELAMESGWLAAEAILESTHEGTLDPSHLAGYRAKCRARLLPALERNRRLWSFFSSPRLLDHLVRAAARSERVRTHLSEILLGEERELDWRVRLAAVTGW